MSLMTAPHEQRTPPPQGHMPASGPAPAPAPQAVQDAGKPVTPHYFVAPKALWSQRINFRMVLLGAIALLFIGVPFGAWLREAMTGGIVNHGTYSDVNLKAMSSFDMNQVTGQVTDIPARFRTLDGSRVALTGEMWSPQDAGDGRLGSFQLVYSKTKCCFSGPPLAQHFVDAQVVRGHNAYMYDNMVRVWGTLHIRFRKDTDGVIKSVYAVDVDKVEPL